MTTKTKPRPPIEAIKSVEQEDKEPLKSPFVDLTQYLDGKIELPKPTMAEVMPGRFLFYSAAVNEVHGEPAVGKTNILLAAAGKVLEAGGKVFFLDPEDSPARMVPRALSLGIDAATLRKRFHYLHDPAPDDYALAHEWAKQLKPELVILDGLAEALAREGFDENNHADILTFFRNRIRPFADNGSAVVIADHVTKSAETRGSWPRGSGAKMGHYHGVSYEIILGETYTPAKAGHVRMKVSKDRNGGVGPKGETVAQLHFVPGEDGMTTTEWKEPTPAEAFRPTELMAKIESHLRLNREANKTELRDLGNSDYVDKAIKALMQDGRLSKQKQGNSHIYALTPKTEE
jgi:hypothetical protein